jgi:hypothetical protein
MIRKLAFVGAALFFAVAMPAFAWAGTCEDTFVKRGNAITGLRYIAMTSVAEMPVDVAINQMRAITAKRGYDIIASEPAAGALLIEQPRSASARAFPLEITATVTGGGVGTVQVEAKLPAGMATKADLVKPELCGMLAELKGGKDGRLAAKAGAGATAAQGAPVALSAQEFSQQISKDAERNAAAIPLRYNNKRFTLSGEVSYVIKDGAVYRVAFKILQPHQLAIRLPNMAANLSEVSCLMGPGTSVFVLQLKPGKSVKLTGTFAEFSEIKDVVWFKDCVPEKK